MCAGGVGECEGCVSVVEASEWASASVLWGVLDKNEGSRAVKERRMITCVVVIAQEVLWKCRPIILATIEVPSVSFTAEHD